MNNITLRKIFAHLKTVHTHRKWVLYYCRLAGIPWRGLVHDLSKYSSTEFWESVRYYQGTSSPINAAKADKGYSEAWLHHKGRNKHHWAYWSDNFSEGFKIHEMPEKYFVEMVCDFLAAGRAYSGDKFTYAGELEWWKHDREAGNAAMNPKNKQMLDVIFNTLAIAALPETTIKSGYIQEIYRKYR